MCRNATVEETSAETRVKDRLPEKFKPEDYVLEIHLKESTVEFFGHVEITGKVLEDTKEIAMHAEKMNIRKVEVRDKDNNIIKTEQRHDDPLLYISGEGFVKGDQLRISVGYDAEVSKGLSGFYRSVDQTEKEVKYIYSTQFEAPHARTALPCWDEPEYKARFAVSITAPEKYVILSNSKEKTRSVPEITETNRHMFDPSETYTQVVFEPTPLMSTYLLAWVIGDLKAVEDGNIRVFSPRGLERHGEYGLGVAKHCLQFFNEYFDFPYQMSKLDMVAIPDFSAGAMENWGLVTYRSSSLHYIEGSTTEKQKMWIAETICHELAHQWFGNLVTMKWWNDLWLNEGFATWAGTLATAAISSKIDLKYDVWEGFLEHDITRGLAMDGKESTHPINMEVASSGDISSIFDAISYSKGGSMIHMLAKYITPEYFKEGLRRYIKKYQYKNTETLDLWRAISNDDPQSDIPHSMKKWINTPGFPIVHVSLSEDAKSVRLHQERYLPYGSTLQDNTLWNIFLTKKSFVGGQMNLQALMFKEKTMELPAEELPLVLNEDASGFYRVKYSAEMLDRSIKPLLEDPQMLTKFDRYGIFRDAVRFSLDNHERAEYALNLFPYISKTEKASVVSIAAGFLQTIIDRFETHNRIRAKAEAQLCTLLTQYEDTVTDYGQISEDVELQQLQLLAVGVLSGIPGTRTHTKALEILNTGGSFQDVHFEYRMRMYIAVARFGGEKGYTFLRGLLTAPGVDEPEKLRSVSAIAFSPEKMKEVFDLFAKETTEIRNQDKMRMVLGLAGYKNRGETLQMFFDSFGSIASIFARTPDHMATFVQGFLSAQYEPEVIKKAEVFFSDKKNLQDAWVPAVNKGLEVAKLAAGFCKKNAEFLEMWAQEATTDAS